MDLSQLNPSISPSSSVLKPGDVLEIRVSVQNTAEHSITLLKWNSLLDPNAGNLGLFAAKDTVNGEVIETPAIKIARKTPPSDDDFVEIAAGARLEATVKLPTLRLKGNTKYSVQAAGKWMAVWEGAKTSNSARLQKLEASTQGEFVTNEVFIECR
ncbi:hypothetical protein UCRPC4_g05778 [Phaeomoniella chlamydospora]|uniref:Uncharacterized protein n=1 Tax=Phaeomoniella chlamydospora TaxID=158046 RepID=A0A0G2GIM4_PHACM|nr:hypothetical protein UCRPC4_g05778 [Phaeomoniella chlamydospora]